jgi:hypothetical protein
MMFMKQKCAKCGAITRMPDDSRCILVRGPRDKMGLDHFYAYCRQCHHVTDLIGAGCLGILMLRPFECVGVIDPQEVEANHPYGTGIFAEKLQDAMKDDGVL